MFTVSVQYIGGRGRSSKQTGPLRTTPTAGGGCAFYTLYSWCVGGGIEQQIGDEDLRCEGRAADAACYVLVLVLTKGVGCKGARSA